MTVISVPYFVAPGAGTPTERDRSRERDGGAQNYEERQILSNI